MKRGPDTPATEKEEITFRLVIQNDRDTHAYVRLFDPEWEKPGVSIIAGEMDDPTLNHRLAWDAYVAGLREKAKNRMRVKQLFLWSPAIAQFLDLFTLHVYDDIGKDIYQNLRVFLSTLDPYQNLRDVIFWDVDFTLTQKTRMAFVVPAFNKVLLDVTYTD